MSSALALPLRPAAASPARPVPVFDEDADPRAVLEWVCEGWPEAVLATALEPGALAILELLHQLGRSLPVVFLDTDLLHPQTYALRFRLQRRYGQQIGTVRPALSVAQQAAVHGPSLWGRAPADCCALRKTEPLRRALAGRPAWLTGESGAPGAAVQWDAAHGLWRVAPLAGWSRAQVLDFLDAHDVPTSGLHREGGCGGGCAPCVGRG